MLNPVKSIVPGPIVDSIPTRASIRRLHISACHPGRSFLNVAQTGLYSHIRKCKTWQ
jgi:hypothetical protein